MEEIRQYEWIAKYLSGELSDKEKILFEQWLQEDAQHQQLLKDTRAVWEESTTYEDTILVDENTAWNKFEGKMAWENTSTEENEVSDILSKDEAKVLKLFPYKRIIQVAAMLLLVAGAFLWMTRTTEAVNDWIMVQAMDNSTEKVELPDGSTVWLNENSQLAYAANFSNNRQLTLKGEAFFEVERDAAHPLSIESGQTITTVLGTSFNIRAYPSESAVEVSVSSGKVSFAETISNTKPLILEKDQTGVLDKGAWKLRKETAVQANRLAWRTKKLTFQDTKMLEVARDMERYFGIKMSNANPLLNNCRFTGEFKEPQLNDVLQAVEFALDIESIQEGNKFTLSGKGCE